MQDIANILVGLDVHVRGHALTHGSAIAAEQALWIAKLTGARVTFVHSVAGDRYVEEGGRAFVFVHEGIPPAARAAMDALVARFQEEGCDCGFVSSEDKPALALVKEAQRRAPALVVLGKHNEVESQPRIGSVAAKVLHKCPGAVWVVKPGSDMRPRKILAATDLTAVGQSALEAAAFVAEAAGSELHVAHAYQLTMEEQLRGAREEQVYEEARAHAEEGVEAQVAALDYDGEIVRHVGCTAPVRGLLVLDEKLDPDLLVMGTISRGGLPGLLMGNTAEKVLPRVSCSILTVKPVDFVSPVTLDD